MGVNPEKALEETPYVYLLTMIDELAYQKEQEKKQFDKIKRKGSNKGFSKGGRKII